MGITFFSVLKKYLLHPKALLVYLIIGVILFASLFTLSVSRSVNRLQGKIEELNNNLYEKDNQVIYYSNTIVYDNQIMRLSNYFNDSFRLLESINDKDLTDDEKIFISNAHNLFYYYRLSIDTNYKD